MPPSKRKKSQKRSTSASRSPSTATQGKKARKAKKELKGNREKQVAQLKDETRENGVKDEKSHASKIEKTLCLNGSSVGKRTGKHYAGCHVSAAGGVDNAVSNAIQEEATSFALFLRNQRSWAAKPLDTKAAERFRALCEEHNFPPHLILPHGSYLANLGSPKPEIREKSLLTLVDELNRCRMLGLTLFNIHPGSSCGEISRDECIQLIAAGINKALGETEGVKVVLENMSKQGNTIGGDFNEIRQIIDLIEDKSRVGVCIDTCHAMAAGYDLSLQEGFDAMMKDFEEMVGFQFLVGMHLNDSKGDAGCHLDRHENIGKGKIGKEGFRRIMNSPHFTDIPLILETPFGPGNGSSYKKEIKILCGLTES